MTSIERADVGESEVEAFFGRSGEVVASELAATWKQHDNREEIFEGEDIGYIIALQADTGLTRFFRIEEVELYSDEHTMTRFSKSRGPEINGLRSGEVIAYQSRGHIHVFIKTQDVENLMLSVLTPVDSKGNALPSEVGSITSGKVGGKFGMDDRERARFEPLNFPGEKAFFLIGESGRLSPEELAKIEEELLAELEEE